MPLEEKDNIKKPEINFKFKEIKLYSSTEWLANNTKKYRQVFEKSKVAYIYLELSFINLHFSRKDWTASLELKCFSTRRSRGKQKEICNLKLDKRVSQFDNIMYVREGWGNKKEGTFWKRGSYFWEVWIDGEKVGTKYFYIEEPSPDSIFADNQYENPFLEVKSIKLFEGSFDDLQDKERKYQSSFRKESTRYIFVDMVFENLVFERMWNCEIFIKFNNLTRELKGQATRLHKVKRGDEEILLTAGWGSNVKGSWSKGIYTAEIVFMDYLLAIIPFEIGEKDVFGNSPIMVPDPTDKIVFLPTHEEGEKQESFDDVMLELNNLIGLTEIKTQVHNHAQYIKYLRLRKEKGFLEDTNPLVHSVFIGNPGTGKTTVAKKMGKLYKKMGLLTKGHVHEVDRVDLVGEYIGQTAPKVKEAIEKARGGVLFIDEAYALARSEDDSKDFGREVLEILLKEMSNGVGNMVVIVAGYPKEMKYFLDSNPGLKSRFKLFFSFRDYMPDELMQIAEYSCKTKQVNLTRAANKSLKQHIVNAYRDRDRTFGNARFVNDIIEKAKINLGLRVMSHDTPKELNKKALSTIILEDIQSVNFKHKRKVPNLPVDEPLLKTSLDELSKLRGMNNVKKEIFELVKLVRYYKESGKDVLNKFFLHTVFVGNPGTGKTTVARILTRIYKALGLIERGHIVETDRQGLIAGFVGQTAIKTNDMIEKAYGGVLFIDEAYALTSNIGMTSGDFGDEAIQTILKRMEDHRGEFYIFATGYPDNMEAFLKANPGLASRFDKILKFDDYEPDMLLEIALDMLEEEKVKIAPKAKTYLKEYFNYIHKRRDKYFGNARTVRNLITEAIKIQNIRLSNLPVEKRKSTAVNKLLLVDVQSFALNNDDDIFQKKSMGFKK